MKIGWTGQHVISRGNISGASRQKSNHIYLPINIDVDNTDDSISLLDATKALEGSNGA